MTDLMPTSIQERPEIPVFFGILLHGLCVQYEIARNGDQRGSSLVSVLAVLQAAVVEVLLNLSHCNEAVALVLDGLHLDTRKDRTVEVHPYWQCPQWETLARHCTVYLDE